jgi:hypothetical protein
MRLQADFVSVVLLVSLIQILVHQVALLALLAANSHLLAVHLV